MKKKAICFTIKPSLWLNAPLQSSIFLNSPLLCETLISTSLPPQKTVDELGSHQKPGLMNVSTFYEFELGSSLKS